MQHDPALRDCGGNRSTVLIGVAACISKLRMLMAATDSRQA